RGSGSASQAVIAALRLAYLMLGIFYRHAAATARFDWLGWKEFIMSKTPAIALTAILLALVAWALLIESNSISIVVNGQPVGGPLKGGIGAAGFIAALIAGFCAAIVLL